MEATPAITTVLVASDTVALVTAVIVVDALTVFDMVTVVEAVEVVAKVDVILVVVLTVALTIDAAISSVAVVLVVMLIPPDDTLPFVEIAPVVTIIVIVPVIAERVFIASRASLDVLDVVLIDDSSDDGVVLITVALVGLPLDIPDVSLALVVVVSLVDDVVVAEVSLNVVANKLAGVAPRVTLAAVEVKLILVVATIV